MLRPSYRWSMNRLVIFAIDIDDVRDIFGAAPALAERLRCVVAAHFSGPTPSKRSWFKPMLRRDPDTEVRTDRPLRGDVDALLSGGHIAPDRAQACWQVFTLWLEELSSAHQEVPYDPALFERIEWDLARSGLNSDYSLRRLADRQLGTPLRPLPDQVAGYAKSVHVAETAEALELAMQSTEMTAETRDFIEPIRRVLGVAVANGLDVVVIGSVN